MDLTDKKRGISVIMPTYNQGAYISGAILSLTLQDFKDWELIIINDGSDDYTKAVIEDYLSDTRIKYLENKSNEGLGACLNRGISYSNYDFISYLPSDDLYFSNHLSSLYSTLTKNENAVLAYSGIKYNSEYSTGKIENTYLQLVQVLHKKNCLKWMTRSELVTDDLYKMFWGKLGSEEKFIPTSRITCEWINHPTQRHRIIRETSGGNIFFYKQYYKVKDLIRYESTSGNFIDEIEDYKKFRTKPNNNIVSGLKILIVGELAYNPERICALEDRGHKLYGLWTTSPNYFNTIGPLPFGNVEDIPHQDWRKRVQEVKPDVIYALLNYKAVPIAHHIMTTNLGIPFIWHFKEGPFFCRQMGTWKQLMELFVLSDGQIYLSNEMKEWFAQFFDQDPDTSLVLDGDLPKIDWFEGKRSTLLSDIDGEIHTVIPGRPYGLSAEHIEELAKHKIHCHFYGNIYHKVWKDFFETANKLAPNYFHSHPLCKPNDWVKELSKYDAGWLHYFESGNYGEYMKATWNDLNIPARLSTLAACGIPMLQRANFEHIVTTQSIVKEMDIGIFFSNLPELSEKLNNTIEMRRIRENLWQKRNFFSFDFHVDRLIDFFNLIIDKKRVK